MEKDFDVYEKKYKKLQKIYKNLDSSFEEDFLAEEHELSSELTQQRNYLFTNVYGELVDDEAEKHFSTISKRARWGLILFIIGLILVLYANTLQSPIPE